MRLFLLPTLMEVGDGSYFFLWGDRDRVMGVTNRLVFSGTNGTYRLILSDGFHGALTADCRQNHRVSLAGEDVTVESHIHVAIFERMPMGIWCLTIRDPQNGPIWTMDQVHAGVVPCRSCMQPLPVDSLGKAAVACGCGSDPVEQLPWTGVPNLFSMKDGSRKANLAQIDPWREALGIRRRAS